MTTLAYRGRSPTAATPTKYPGLTGPRSQPRLPTSHPVAAPTKSPSLASTGTVVIHDDDDTDGAAGNDNDNDADADADHADADDEHPATPLTARPTLTNTTSATASPVRPVNSSNMPDAAIDHNVKRPTPPMQRTASSTSSASTTSSKSTASMKSTTSSMSRTNSACTASASASGSSSSHAAYASDAMYAPSHARSAELKTHISFNVGSRYRVCEVIGEGAYGVVCSAIHRPSGMRVAIKKIQPFDHQMFALRTLREMRLLRYFQDAEVSDNIISILDLVRPPSFEGFKEVYLIQELMETDLHRVIRSQKLSDDHAQYFTYQVLRALKAIHSADVIHRDLKPSNLLLNANCDLKVCDFGLSRSLKTAEPAEGSETGLMTEYVATRWYRAPEIMLTFKQYSKAIDVWAVGCILAEMIGGRPLFPGRDYHDQLSLILNVLGTPTIDEFYTINSKRSRDYIRAMPFRKRRSFASLYPQASPAAIDFLERTLTFSPKNRATVEELLEHPYLSAYHDEDDEPTCEAMPKEMWECDHKADLKRNGTEKLREQLWDEIMDFRPLI